MSPLDLTIVVLSLIGLVVFAGWLARRQRHTADYYLGGGRLPAWALGLSLAANQVSAISLIGAPAFVALRPGGGLGWLQYELAVPLAMAALILWGVPFLRRAAGAEVYEVVEARLGPGARRLLAAFFLVGRGLGAGVVLYASSLVVDACTAWGFSTSLLVTVASLVRFPLVLTYCLFGLMLAAFLAATPDFAQSLVGRPPDALVPQFLVTYLPTGIVGVVVAGILAAALSSIDSALNSLSAVVVEEFSTPGLRRDPARQLWWARVATIGWGVAATTAAWFFSRAGETSIELINKVGSALYGPVLAVFLLAWRSRRADGWSAVGGAVAGLLANLALAAWAPGISWLWWNVVGCGVTLAIGVAFGRSKVEVEAVGDREGRGYARILVIFFVVILALLAWATIWLR